MLRSRTLRYLLCLLTWASLLFSFLSFSNSLRYLSLQKDNDEESLSSQKGNDEESLVYDSSGSSSLTPPINDTTVAPKQSPPEQCPHPFIHGKEVYHRNQHEDNIFATRPNSTLLVIGANVGATDTDGSWKIIRKYPHVHKILVEPIPTLFAQLTRNVQKSSIQNVVLRNLAIGEQKGHTTMYCWDLPKIKPLRLPYWFTQICSFDRDRLYKNEFDTAPALRKKVRQGQVKNLQDFVNEHILPISVEQDRVQGVLETALGENNLRQVSVVQIDAEGFDYHIVLQLPFEQAPDFRPCLVIWEKVLLTDEQNNELKNRIAPLGYGSAVEGENIVMYRLR